MSNPKLRLGVIGAGMMAARYLDFLKHSGVLELTAIASRGSDAASEVAERFGMAAMSVDALLSSAAVDVVLNLAPAQVHAELTLNCLAAGKHVYSEKPLATEIADARAILAAAAVGGLRVGCAPDTFLGGAHQAARHAIDSGLIGKPFAGAAAFATRGMEMWHPDPRPFYAPGGGVLLDMGPYYVTHLVSLFGPVVQVTAQTSRGFAERIVTSQPLAGTKLSVDVATTVNGTLSFESDANVAITMSWDVTAHQRNPLEIYGTEGSLSLPDPNWFGGEVLHAGEDGVWHELASEPRPFFTSNQRALNGSPVADYRGAGLIDMVQAIQEDRPHRATAVLAFHVLEVLTALEDSARQGRRIDIQSRVEQPAPLTGGSFDMSSGARR